METVMFSTVWAVLRVFSYLCPKSTCNRRLQQHCSRRPTLGNSDLCWQNCKLAQWSFTNLFLRVTVSDLEDSFSNMLVYLGAGLVLVLPAVLPSQDSPAGAALPYYMMSGGVPGPNFLVDLGLHPHGMCVPELVCGRPVGLGLLSHGRVKECGWAPMAEHHWMWVLKHLGQTALPLHQSCSYILSVKKLLSNLNPSSNQQHHHQEDTTAWMLGYHFVLQQQESPILLCPEPRATPGLSTNLQKHMGVQTDRRWTYLVFIWSSTSALARRGSFGDGVDFHQHEQYGTLVGPGLCWHPGLAWS